MELLTDHLETMITIPYFMRRGTSYQTRIVENTSLYIPKTEKFLLSVYYIYMHYFSYVYI